MSREDILRILATHRGDLARLGVRELSLFGSRECLGGQILDGAIADPCSSIGATKI